MLRADVRLGALVGGGFLLLGQRPRGASSCKNAKVLDKAALDDSALPPPSAPTGRTNAQHRLQLGDHLGHRLLPVVGLLGHHPLKTGVQFGGHLGPGLAKRWDRALAVRQKNLHQRLAAVGRIAGQEPVKRAAQGIDVGPVIGHVAVQSLLGRHVVAGAHHLAGRCKPLRAAHGRFGPGDAGQAHVEDLDRPFFVQQQIARLDVAVDDAFAVGILQSASRLEDALDRLPDASGPRSLTMVARSWPSTYSIAR